MKGSFVGVLLLGVLMAGRPAVAEQQADGPEGGPEKEVLAGHSQHGEVFNEGPRQAAYVMEGTGRVCFPATTCEPLAQQFITQGVGQLHGFWYFEAERSFRQAAALDPDCALAYWGAAMANLGNRKRAQGFIDEAVRRKAGASRRETLYIDALDAYLKADPKKKKPRGQAYVKALERIVYEFPEDIEAKALLAGFLWKERSDALPLVSHLAVDALLEQVLQAEPLHPAHHYRIHLWDYERPENALASSALCGPAAPAIAHMWHMPGHIYSRLKRYEDAVWQQEASARVDHAHMMRDRVLPDQIHNFAHNNEWLIRNLNHIGRVRDAVELAKNMCELPRHPTYNSLSKRGSAHYGRLRLLETLKRFELWEELIALSQTPYLEPTDDEKLQVSRLRHLAAACFRSGAVQQGQTHLASLQQRLQQQQQQRQQAVEAAENEARQKARPEPEQEAEQEAEQEQEAGQETEQEQPQEPQADPQQTEIEKAGREAGKPFDSLIRDLEKAVSEVQGHQAVCEQRYADALPLLKEAGGVDPLYLARVQLQAGERDEALEAAEKHVRGQSQQVQPLACWIDLLWQAGDQEKAAEVFGQLRQISSSIDLQSPVFGRLAPIACQLGLPADWRLPGQPADDLGERPELDELGPFRWSPSPASDWTLQDVQGHEHSLEQFGGRPVILVFYLGHACLHCAEQLHSFAPMSDQFEQAGITLAAISTDDMQGLKRSLQDYQDGPLPIPLLADPELDVFKTYRAYDDFEQQPLHGTFLIDAQGLVRWQDISYQPFMDAQFLLEEAQRLLGQTP